MSRVQMEIFLGTILITIAGIILLWYGLGEEVRMARFEESQRAQAIEVGAELFDNNCSSCHGIQGEGVPGLCPPLNDSNFFDGRLDEVNWAGSQEDYIVSVVSSGRTVSTRPDLYAGQGVPAMPAWSEDYGGPLRADQIRSIAQFIMNWEAGAPDRSQMPEPSGPAVGTDIAVELPEGNPTNGEVLAASQGCVACHVSALVGPAWMPTDAESGIGSRAESRLEQADYTGSAATPEQYLIESIIRTNDFIVEGFPPNVMPDNYGENLSAQDLADLVAYLQSIE